MKKVYWILLGLVLMPLTVSSQTPYTHFCWLPSPSTDVAGYKLYNCGATTPCTSAQGTEFIDVPVGNLETCPNGDPNMVATPIPVPSEGNATVVAYDGAGNLSPDDGTVFFDKAPPQGASSLGVQ